MKLKLKSAVAAMALFVASVTGFAQNDKADAILGKFYSKQGADEYKVLISKKSNGSYKAQIYWVADPIDHKTGKKALDPKNPDKSLRNVPCDEIVLIDGLKYNADKKQWDGTKIYDPQRGIKASVTVKFTDPKTLAVRGTVLGIGETAIWVRVDE